MKRHDIRDYLQDILEAITDIEEFVANMTYEEFVKDRKTLNAAVRSIESLAKHPKNFLTPSNQNSPTCPGKKSQACETNSSMHTSAWIPKPSGKQSNITSHLLNKQSKKSKKSKKSNTSKQPQVRKENKISTQQRSIAKNSSLDNPVSLIISVSSPLPISSPGCTRTTVNLPDFLVPQPLNMPQWLP